MSAVAISEGRTVGLLLPFPPVRSSVVVTNTQNNKEQSCQN
jgi:hypothetical protein